MMLIRPLLISIDGKITSPHDLRSREQKNLPLDPRCKRAAHFTGTGFTMAGRRVA